MNNFTHQQPQPQTQPQPQHQPQPQPQPQPQLDNQYRQVDQPIHPKNQYHQFTNQQNRLNGSFSSQAQTKQKRYEYAGFWIRFLASLIDGTIISGLIYFASSNVSSFFAPMLIDTKAIEESVVNLDYSGIFEAQNNLHIFNALFVYFLTAIVTITFWGLYAATPGKMILKLKITDKEGNKIPWIKAILRYFSYFISNIFYLGYLWVAFNPKKQAWHDKIAKTYVMREIE